MAAGHQNDSYPFRALEAVDQSFVKFSEHVLTASRTRADYLGIRELAMIQITDEISNIY
jgi:hypothetical protein